MRLKLRAAAAMFLMAASCGGAIAAGGHHAVDDASILEPGVCELESWFTRSHGGERLLHAGAGCRVGPVELGVAGEYARQGGASQAGYALQAKWAAGIAEGLSVGASLTPATQAHVRPRYQGTTVSALVTWAAQERVALHANIGRDFVHRGADQNRSGVSAEWTIREGWSLVGERYYENRTHYARAGARWAISEKWSADLSRAQRLRGPGESSWTLGMSWLFGPRLN
ncbi:MAG TPA: hypothetical protein VK996_11185 [Ramlibacter sp.]|nr:hypothetical protein [Ramlibacter sp.]